MERGERIGLVGVNGLVNRHFKNTAGELTDGSISSVVWPIILKSRLDGETVAAVISDVRRE